jgi:hypothetical protein
MPDMVVVCFFSLYKVPQVPKCPNILVVVLKGWGYAMLLDDKTIFAKGDDDVVYVGKGVFFHRVINPHKR